jgi:hypothetical protein
MEKAVLPEHKVCVVMVKKVIATTYFTTKAAVIEVNGSA